MAKVKFIGEEASSQIQRLLVEIDTSKQMIANIEIAFDDVILSLKRQIRNVTQRHQVDRDAALAEFKKSRTAYLEAIEVARKIAGVGEEWVFTPAVMSFSLRTDEPEAKDSANAVHVAEKTG